MADRFYIPFDKYMIRTPLFPVDKESVLRDFKNNQIFKEALFFSSPELYNLIEIQQEFPDNGKMVATIEKYFSRCIHRCTPFGLFAGISIGKWGQENRIELAAMSSYKKHSRLDMSYMQCFIEHMERLDTTYKWLKYFPNNTIYKIGDQIRYVESFPLGLSDSAHKMSSVELDEYISKVLTLTQNGATIEELASVITDEEIPYEEAESFILSIIDAQLIISELQLKTTGTAFLTELTDKISTFPDEISGKLVEIKRAIAELDNCRIGHSLDDGKKTIDLIQKTEISSTQKYFIQTDLYKPVICAELSDEIATALEDIISFYCLIGQYRHTHLSRFKEAFLSRYGDEDIPLAYALDNEIGIGYPVKSSSSGDVDELIHDIRMPKSSKNGERTISEIDGFMMQKLIEAKKTNARKIVLTKNDFPYKRAYNSPNTLFVLCSIIENNGSAPSIFIKYIEPSAAALIGRFCGLDPEIHNLASVITKKEKEYHPDAILAEIVHLPTARMGNIALRPVLYDYEIPYVTPSSVPLENQVHVSDILVSVENDQIMLRSKKHNKQIIPRLTNAHDFSNNSMPLYHFLCDLTCQTLDRHYGFSWGPLFDMLDYLPRVQYNGHIMSREKWRIKSGEIIMMKDYEDGLLLQSITSFRCKYNIPERIIFISDKQEIYINLKFPESIRTLLAMVKHSDTFEIEEDIFAQDNGFVSSPDGHFTNEFIFPFYKRS